MKFFLSLICLLLLCTVSCKKLDTFPDNPVDEVVQSEVIMHRGGGQSGAGRNTVAGAIFGMQNCDGIELDVQVSKDGTPWLAHDALIEACDDFKKSCFVELTDTEIEDRVACGEFSTEKLEDVFAAAGAYPNTRIVLDCKAWSPCGVSKLNPVPAMKKMGKRIVELAKEFDLEDNIVIDSSVKSLLCKVRKESDIKTYYRSFSSLDKAARTAFRIPATGLSLDQKRFELSEADIELIHSKGLELQLWTMKDLGELNAAMELKPDMVISEVQW